MNEQKIDYPPLLPAGLHAHTLETLQVLTVDQFPNSRRRAGLFTSLSVYLDLLAATGLKASIWVDGSFMCTKQLPEDIDLVVVWDGESPDTLSAPAIEQLNCLLNTNMMKARFGLHVFGVDGSLPSDMDFWRQKFGTQRDEVTPKGLAEIKVNK